MEKIRVLIADDHPTFREGLCRILNDEEDLEVVVMAANGKEAVDLALEMKPDVAIIDVNMPDISGIEAARQIKQACRSISILIISAYDYESYVIESMRAGASGYVLKDMPIYQLLNAIRMVAISNQFSFFRNPGYES